MSEHTLRTFLGLESRAPWALSVGPPPTWVSAAAFPPLSVPKPLDFDGGVVGIGVGSYSAYPWFSLLAHVVLFLPLLLFLVLLFQFNGSPRLVCSKDNS